MCTNQHLCKWYVVTRNFYYFEIVKFVRKMLISYNTGALNYIWKRNYQNRGKFKQPSEGRKVFASILFAEGFKDYYFKHISYLDLTFPNITAYTFSRLYFDIIKFFVTMLILQIPYNWEILVELDILIVIMVILVHQSTFV